MICLIHWCCQGNHLCSLAGRTTNDKISFLKVVLFFRGCPFVTSSHSVCFYCVCAFLYPSHRFSSPLLFTHTHTLPHQGCLNRWKSSSEPSETLICFTANTDPCISALITAVLRISSAEMKPGFSERACGYLPAVIEGSCWRQPCADAFEECKVSVHNIYIHLLKKPQKNWVEDKELISALYLIYHIQ